jgi:hypothetical protein
MVQFHYRLPVITRGYRDFYRSYSPFFYSPGDGVQAPYCFPEKSRGYRICRYPIAPLLLDYVGFMWEFCTTDSGKEETGDKRAGIHERVFEIICQWRQGASLKGIPLCLVIFIWFYLITPFSMYPNAIEICFAQFKTYSINLSSLLIIRLAGPAIAIAAVT